MDLDGQKKFFSAQRDSFSSSSRSDRNEEDQQELLEKWQKGGKGLAKSSVLRALIITTCCLAAIAIIQAAAILHMKKELSRQIPRYSPNGLSNYRDKTLLAHVPTRFWKDDNDTLAESSWRNIEAGHGLVAVDPSWAASKGLPETLIHPRDPTKRIYVIEAYHAIHCLQNLRRHYFNLRRGETPDRPLEHDLHCFDSLRQSVMCHANDELLWTSGHNDAGINQTRQCRDWDALRDWASERTSCYHDYTAPPGETRWGKCDHGIDGLPYNSLLS